MPPNTPQGDLSQETVPWSSASLSAHPLYAGAYLTALVGGLISAWLTYTYVGNGARELNPILRFIIGVIGLEAMVFLKTAVVIGCFRGYSMLAAYCSPWTVLTFAWIGAFVNAANAVHDTLVAVTAGWPPSADVLVGGALLFICAMLGVLFRPHGVGPTTLRAPF